MLLTNIDNKKLVKLLKEKKLCCKNIKPRINNIFNNYKFFIYFMKI